MRAKILFPLILGLSLQWLSGSGTLPSHAKTFFLLIHSESEESSWTKGLKEQFRKHGIDYSGNLESGTWLFRQSAGIRSYATLSMPAQASEKAGTKRIEKAVSLLKRKFNGSSLRLILVSEPRLKKISKSYLASLKNSQDSSGISIEHLDFAQILEVLKSSSKKIDD